MPIRSLAGRVGASCCGEPVARSERPRLLGGHADVPAGAKHALRAGECPDHDRRRARGAREVIRVPKILVQAALEIAVARGRDLSPPALHVDAPSVVREVQPRAVRAPVGAVGVRRRRARTDDHCAGRRVAGVERVAPARRKAGRPRVVDRVVEVLEPVAGGFHDDLPLEHGVADGGEVVRPPLDRDEPELALLRVGSPRPRTVNLQEDDVAAAELVGRRLDRCRGRLIAER